MAPKLILEELIKKKNIHTHNSNNHEQHTKQCIYATPGASCFSVNEKVLTTLLTKVEMRKVEMRTKQ